VMPGDVLRLPPGKSIASTPTAPPPSSVKAPSTPPAAPPSTAPSSGTYTVKPGDWLIGIAMAHGVKVRDLIAVNDMQLDSLVYAGLVLKLPAGAKAPTTPVTPPASPAPAPAPTPATTPAPAPSAAPGVQPVIDFLMAQLGKPYKFFSAGPDSFDCSGLSKAAYATIGVSLTHFSRSQATAGVAVDWLTQPILPGDLVFTATGSTPGVIGHLGIAIDSKRWIHAPRAGDVVKIGQIPSASKILAVRRLVPSP
jgi:cell wall-associated NlpC family hydrolase